MNLQGSAPDAHPLTVRRFLYHPGLAGAGLLAVILGVLGYRFLAKRRSASPIPKERHLDSTVALLREGYTFISTRCERLASDVFETRLMLQRAFCMTGEEAARVFYVPDRFTRRQAIPMTTLMLLQDWGSVQTLEGDAHRHRKQMFMSLLMTPGRIQQLVDIADQEWRAGIERWRRRRRVVLHDEAREILCRAVCGWAGVPLLEREVVQRAREFGAMIDGSGSIGPRNWRGQMLRRRTERWIQGIIEDIRSGRIGAAPDTAAYVIAWHRGADGQLLRPAKAAVELINVLRPMVAVSRFITFAALAMHEHPQSRADLESGGDEYLEWFAQEVRRFYPFFPAIGGRVRTEFSWKGHHFAKGTWVLLDLYGTNHDARIWHDPESFRPNRFKEWDGSPFNFIPQGGGSYADGHRCPGEAITTELVKTAVRHLSSLQYQVPTQNLLIDMANMPALPASGFILANVRMTNDQQHQPGTRNA